MLANSAQILLPIPAKLTLTDAVFPVKQLTTFAIDQKFSGILPELHNLFRTLGVNVDEAAGDAALSISESDLPPGAWQMTVSDDGIRAGAGDITGAFYIVNALAQMLFAATATGDPQAVLNGAEIADHPRFAWRSFHLDCARHFQQKEIVKKFLRILSLCRINIFHWHLADSQGWRYQSSVVPLLKADGSSSYGQYTREEVQEIVQFAKSLGITVIPEVDVPGHSAFLLSHYPQFACDPATPGEEFCLGKKAVMEFLKEIFSELMTLFPDSPYIHIGGDEAATGHWENCPECRRAMKEKGLKNMRELENQFMIELSRFIAANGRTPVIWGTCSGQTYPADTMIQVWLDIREPLKIAPHGNKIIYSVHSSLYFDYPADLSEPWESWMFELSEKGVYMTDPYIIWPEKVKDVIVGTEACLWTETIPQHRIFAKLFPRIFAYSECAWSLPERKSWHDFTRRKSLLEASGYIDYVKGV